MITAEVSSSVKSFAWHKFGQSVFFSLVILSVTQTVSAQTPAFPGALGYGSYATGGRGGTVYHVTNLNDSGAGSFRDAVSHSGRIIVFDVGGHVTLLSAVTCQGNITIAGQTSPGGICFDAGEISFSSRRNIICRYIRVRPGSNTASTGDDCLGMYQTTNAMIDHVSVGFGPYDNIDAVSSDAVSIQNCIDADPIGQQFGAHVESGGAWSWQYNLFVNSHNRNPLAKTYDTFINNVEYNCNAGYTTHTSGHFVHDIVNNYFVAGPAYGGSSSFPWFQVDNNQSVYEPGNLFDGNDNGGLDGGPTTVYWYQGGAGGTVLSAPWSSWTSLVPAAPAPLAWRYNVSAAGAFPRDDMDSLIISQVKTLGSGTTGTGAGTVGPDGGLYTSQTQTGLSNSGYGSFTGGTAPANFSGDGIADYWKLANNLSTNISYPLTNTADGFSLLEHYLNFLGAPHAVTQSNVPVDINLSQFTGGFGLLASASFTLTNATNGTVTLTGGNTAHFVPNAGFSGLGTFTFTVTESGYALSAPVTVCVTPIVPPASATGFNGAMVVVATNATASVTAPPSNLTWHGDGTANVWNLSVSNWLNGAAVVAFKNGDVVTFDDTGSSTPAINLNTPILPGAIYFNNSQNYTLSGISSFSGSGAFNKTGNGTVTIGTTNSGFTGAINISGGTVALNNGVSIGSGPITLSGGAAISLPPSGGATFINGNVTVPAGQTATLASVATGNGVNGTINSGDNTSLLNLSGSVSFTGTSSAQFDGFSGTINIPAGATFRFSANSGKNTFGSLHPDFIINGTLQPRNSTNTIVLGALNGSGQLTGPQTANTGTGPTIYLIGGKNQDAIFNGTIVSNANSAGSAICIVKTGTGSQTLNGNNTCTGTNAVTQGALFLNGANIPSLCTVYSGATLGGTGVVSGVVTVNSGGILSPGKSGSGSFGAFTINGNLNNNSPVLNFDLSGNPSGNNDRLNVGGTLAMSGVQTFNFNLTDNALGAGSYPLIEGAPNSTQSGVTFASNLPGNTRQNISFNVAAPGSNPSYVRLNVTGSPDSLVWTGTNGSAWDTATINWFNGAGADQFYNLDSVTFDDSSTNGTVLLAANLQPAAIVVTNNSLDYVLGGTGALIGSGPLTKTGSGALTINTTNSSYNGNIVLAGGTLALGGGTSLGTGNMSIGSGATLSLPASGNSVTVARAITVPAGQTAVITSGVLSSTLGGAFISSNNASILDISGGVSFSGANSSQLDGFTGTIDLFPGGTLRFSGGSSNIFGSFNTRFIIDGLLQPRNAGNIIQLGAFTGSGTLAGPQSNTGSGDTLYVIGGNNTSATFSGTISSNTAVAASQVIVNKIGTGTLTLSGTNTFAGGLTVSAGTLLVDNTSGSATGTGDLEVFSGATLTGNGIIASATTVDNGATLAPGNPAGTLVISNNLTLNDSSLLQFGLGTNGDSVAVGGDLALTGQLSVTNSGGFAAGSYPLFTYGGALSFGNLQLALTPPGYNYNFDTSTPGVVKLVVTSTAPLAISTPGINGAGNFVFSGSGGQPGAPYYVIASTNLAAPIASWQRILTNQFDSGGNFSVTNGPLTNAQEFYKVQY